MAKRLKKSAVDDEIDKKIKSDNNTNELNGEKNISKDNEAANGKVLFVQRLFAYLLDVILISLIISVISSPFINVEESNKLNEKALELVDEYKKGEVTFKDYSIQYMDLTYKLARNNGISSIMTIIIYLLYFVVLQIYNGGQTIGKKIMKIRVISDDGELNMNQMIFRSLIANSILVDIIAFAFMVFSSKDIYFWAVGLFSLIQYAIVIISIFMVMYSKDGLAIHDKWFHTRVIKTN